MNDIIIGLDKSLKENDDEDDDYCWNEDSNFSTNFFRAYEEQLEFSLEEGDDSWGHYCCIYPLN